MDIGLVSWNTRDDLRHALESVRAFAGGGVRRVVVVDNASSDGTPEMVRGGFPEVELVAEPDNRGFAAGVNRLFERTAPNDVLVLNADVLLTEGAVERLEAALVAHPRAGAIAPRLAYEDGSTQHSAHRFPSLRVAAWLNSGLWRTRSARWQSRELLETVPQPAKAGWVDWAIGAALAVRRTAVDQVGGLDESFFMYAEDLEWCHRAAQAGWGVYYEPAATVTHLGNRSGEQAFGGKRTAAWLQSTYAFARRAHGPAWTAAYYALNAGGTGARYAGARLRNAVRPSERSRQGIATWGPHVAYHLRRSRPLPRGNG